MKKPLLIYFIEVMDAIFAIIFALFTLGSVFATVCYEHLGLTSVHVIYAIDFMSSVGFLSSIANYVSFKTAYHKQKQPTKIIFVSASILLAFEWIISLEFEIIALAFISALYLMHYIHKVALSDFAVTKNHL